MKEQRLMRATQAITLLAIVAGTASLLLLGYVVGCEAAVRPITPPCDCYAGP